MMSQKSLRNKTHAETTSLQCLSTINIVFSDEDKILIKKKLVFEGVHSEEVDRRIS